jgi:RimJ/RimL family protein N-acetyltransferase
MLVVAGRSLDPIEVDGVRSVLRPFTIGDVPLVVEASHDEYIPMIGTIPANASEADAVAYIDRQHSRLTTGAGWSLAIADRSTGRAVGGVGLWITNIAKGRSEMGYWVVESQRRRGFAVDALASLATWAFEEIDGLFRLSLFIEPWNTGSIRTAERAGFEREAVLRDWELVGGEPKDMWSYVRTRQMPPTRLPA